jgi:hypothetical protein
MAIVVRSANASLDANQKRQVLAGNAYAGEALEAVAPCYIKSSDGKVYMCDGAANNEAAEFIGFTPRAVALGEPVTLYGWGTRFQYSTGMTPGTILYIRDADAYYDAGNLDTSATTGDTLGTAVALTATDILVTRTRVQGG